MMAGSYSRYQHSTIKRILDSRFMVARPGSIISLTMQSHALWKPNAMNAGLAKLDEIDPDAPERIGGSLREVAEYARLGHKKAYRSDPGLRAMTLPLATAFRFLLGPSAALKELFIHVHGPEALPGPWDGVHDRWGVRRSVPPGCIRTPSIDS
ncbi:MAG: hypothetical protein METHP_02074 [Methanoregula sp. SKADARSKE-2]|nr:MAG: hypothetical protein METHP_02074 [Methanoregula sp. SKADARSKE-2]